MPSSNPKLTIAQEKRYIGIIFFLFAFEIMSWVPRFPEVKANLGLSNGEFGTCISLGSIFLRVLRDNKAILFLVSLRLVLAFITPRFIELLASIN